MTVIVGNEPVEVEVTVSPVEVTVTPVVAAVVIETVSVEVTVVPAPAEVEVQVTGPGGAAGPQNLFVQETQPVMPTPGLWVELNPDLSVKTMWAGTT